MRRAILLALLLTLAATPAALAATPPAVSTSPATNVTAGGATLNGTVNPQGQATQYAFQWGPTAGYGHQTPVPATSAGSTTTPQTVSAALTGLDPGTTYHFRIIAFNASGVATGTDQTFTTTGSPPPPSTPPTATTGVGTDLGQSTATVNGTVNPQGQSTSYYFEYGTTSDYGFETAPTSAGSGSAPTPATANLTGLQSSTTYHFRLVAVSPGGTALGTDQTLTTTTPPTVTTQAASAINQSGATLNGLVNPQGQTTTYYFQFGTTTGYGFQTAPANAGSGTTSVAVAATLTNLASGTTYHYRLVAQNAGGTSFGSDLSFKTTGSPAGTSRLRLFGHTAFVSPSGVAGIFVACIGDSKCIGHMKISRSRITLGQRSLFTLGSNDGGFVHLQLTSLGTRLLRQRHHLPVSISVTDGAGSTTTSRVTLVSFS
jgi:hypothetical protein